jgi:hypothetical protein
MRWTALIAALVVPGSAHGQPGLALSPLVSSVRTGEAVIIRALETDGSSTREVAWPASIDWFFVRLAGTQENRGREDAPTPAPDGTLRVPLAQAGAAMIGVDLPPRTMEWPAQFLSDFAARAGRDDICPAEPCPVRFLSSATTLVRAEGAAPPDEGTPTGKSGQQVEIRPLIDPTFAAPPGVLPLRVYLQGEGVSGAVVRATHVPTGRTATVRTDAKGIAEVSVDKPGRWRLEVRIIKPLVDEDAAYLAACGTLTFEAPDPKAEKSP